VSTRDERRRALVQQFQAVAAERLSKLARTWVVVEQERAGTPVEELFRELHTLKGEARAVGYRTAAAWLHALESLLGTARARGFPRERAVSDAVLAVLDSAGETFSQPPAPPDAGPPPLPELLERANAVLGAVESGGPPVPAPPSPPPQPPGPAAADATDPLVRVARGKLDGLSDLCDQLLVLRAESAYAVQGLRASAGRVERAVLELQAEGAAGRELAAATRALVQQAADHEDSLYRQGLVVDALEGAVREMRFVRASTLLHAYPRYVRELALAGGKEVRLELEGEAVEADRRVLEHLREPLLHLVRNAVDHGIEPDGERVSAGKPPAGTLRLAVAQRGGRLTLEAEDDGHGIDVGRIKERAVELGMLTQAQAGAMKDAEAMELIFVSGFSTRRQVSETSGRGIGMDVVKRRLEQIGGRVDVESRLGQGTRVRLTAPLSVSVTRALLLEQGSELYAVPAASVDAVRRVTAPELASIPSGKVLRHGEALLPVRRLWEEVRGTQGAAEMCVVLRSGLDQVALLCDAVAREADLIVRPIEAPLGSLALIAGAALLGSGRLVLLLEPGELVRGGEVSPFHPVPEGRRLQILLVEDSVIFQATIADLLRSRGHRVAVAGNGAEGLERAASVHPDVIITDIEMPVMDGYRMIQALREREDTRRVPVVTLSGLGSREVKAKAMASGANHCLVKAELDEEHLLELIRQLAS